MPEDTLPIIPPDDGDVPDAHGDRGPYSLRRRPPTPRESEDIRTPYAVDCDRILHSMAYSRYIDKTQVFWLVKNDHVTHRVLHVQLVSRIARTVGKTLGLNLDLLEASALGHDLGHPPFGHDGEAFLSALSEKAGIGKFVHAVMSVRFLEKLERGGRGLNLTLGVLDSILCHDGESDFASLRPSVGPIDFGELDRRIEFRKASPEAMLSPMTAEGCVMRLCDSISYVGRDLEDAILLGHVKREEIPKNVAKVLGQTNGTIVYSLVKNLTENAAARKPYVCFGPETGEALTELKNFNRERIYHNPAIKKDRHKIKRLFSVFFEMFSEDFARPGGPTLPMLSSYAKNMGEEYGAAASPPEKARDFLAGMTDDYFLETASELLLPKYEKNFR
ncbi:MAG: HD domain-containing protein [Deltaproteobacteria bacterium]|jgi:dGTPase|nr:HD domain-containing protein [Deltaproteobacteria bacterium]